MNIELPNGEKPWAASALLEAVQDRVVLVAAQVAVEVRVVAGNNDTKSNPQRKLSPYEQTHLARFDKRNIAIEDFGETPVEYITGKAEFYNRVFSVNKDVLIPRIETEELIGYALREVETLLKKKSGEPLVMADVGTGSGAIGVTLSLELAKKYPDASFKVFLSDVSAEAVAVAKQNAEDLGAATIALTSDLLSDYPKNTVFDVLIANLPYIPHDRINSLGSSVKDYEPHIALSGGPQGLTLVHRFLFEAEPVLKKHGVIYLETDHTHTSEAEIIPTKLQKKFDAVSIKDDFGQPRFWRIVKKNNT